MTYADFYAARLLVAEMRYGAPLREALRARDRAEDAAFDNTIAHLRRKNA